MAKVYFSDFFDIDHTTVENYGALDISLITDNPAFVDPFLIFYSKKKEYKVLHKFIVDYMVFLNERTLSGDFSFLYYTFPEVSQVWLGYSRSGNKGLGLGPKFATELNSNIRSILSGKTKKITKSSHMEKLCIVGERVGVDKISDFTLNLIKKYLVEYTEEFAKKHLKKSQIGKFRVSKLYFNFETGDWVDGEAILPVNPHQKSDYVLLTPKDILVREEGWISVNDFLNSDGSVIGSIPNEDLRFKINKFFLSLIPIKLNKKGKKTRNLSRKYTREALRKTAKEYPEIIDYFIKKKEDSGSGALDASIEGNDFLSKVLYVGVKEIAKKIDDEANKGKDNHNSLSETLYRVKLFKHVMEERDGYDVFWDGEKLRKFKEPDVDKMIDLVFASSVFSVDRQVNNGRGESDIKISMGAKDSTLIETKLAKNTQLEKNLKNQLDIYKQANKTDKGVYVVLFFSDSELKRVKEILQRIDILKYVDERIFLIDCRKKISASKIS